MSLAVTVVALSGILAAVGNLPGFGSITSIPSLCTNYANLATNPNTGAVLNSASVTSLLNGSTVPQLCTLLNTATKSMLPQVFISFKVLEPFAALPGFDPRLRTLMQTLGPLNGMSTDDPNLLQVVMQPNILATVIGIESIRDLFMDVVTGVGVLPIVCDNPAVSTSLFNLLNGTSFTTVCKNINITSLTTDIATLTKMRTQNPSTGGRGLQEIIKMIPQLVVAMKVLKPFMTLPGFDPTLLALMQAFGPLADMSHIDSNFFGLLSQPNIQAAVGSLEKTQTQVLLTNIFAAIGGLPNVCASPSYFTSLQKLLQGASVSTLCNTIDTTALKKNLAALLNMTGIAGGMPVITNTPRPPHTFKKELPRLLDNIPGPLVNMTGIAGGTPEITNIPGIPDVFKKELPGLLDILPGLLALTKMPNLDPKLVAILKALTPLSGMTMDDPNLMRAILIPSVLTALVKLHASRHLIYAELDTHLTKLKELQRLARVPGIDPKLKALLSTLAVLSKMNIDDPNLKRVLLKPAVISALMQLQEIEVNPREMQDIVDRYYVGYFVLSGFIFFFNTVLYMTFFFMKKDLKMNIANILLCNQAFSDAIVAVAVLLQSVHNKHYSYDIHMGRCAMFFLHYSYYLSCNCLLLNAFERMCAFNFRHTHAKIFSSPLKVVFVIFIMFVLSAIPPICHSAYVDIIEDPIKYNQKYATYMTVFFGLLLVTVVLVYSFSIVTFVAVHKQKNVRSMEVEMDEMGKRGGDLNETQKSYIAIFLAHSIFFALSYLPIAIVVILDISADDSGLVMEHFLVVVIVYMVSALFNPIITMLFKDDYRNTLLCRKQLVKEKEGQLLKFGNFREENLSRAET